jgi:hypothetical protein
MTNETQSHTALAVSTELYGTKYRPLPDLRAFELAVRAEIAKISPPSNKMPAEGTRSIRRPSAAKGL